MPLPVVIALKENRPMPKNALPVLSFILFLTFLLNPVLVAAQQAPVPKLPPAANRASSQTAIYTYDQNGNLISDGVQCYSYNEANQLAAVRICADNSLIAEYVYDHTGQRLVEKLYQDGQLADTVYTIGGHSETTLDSDNNRSDTTYYRANNELIARKNSDQSRTYYHQDHLGSTGAMTNAAGELVEETRYYPFGAVRSGGSQSRYLYTGQEADPETGLYYYNARFYHPNLRRFTQPDLLLPNPTDPQQLNRYSYVNNNPLKYVDPSGKVALIVWVLGVAAVSYAGWKVYKASLRAHQSIHLIGEGYGESLSVPEESSNLEDGNNFEDVQKITRGTDQLGPEVVNINSGATDIVIGATSLTGPKEEPQLIDWIINWLITLSQDIPSESKVGMEDE